MFDEVEDADGDYTHIPLFEPTCPYPKNVVDPLSVLAQTWDALGAFPWLAQDQRARMALQEAGLLIDRFAFLARVTVGVGKTEAMVRIVKELIQGREMTVAWATADHELAQATAERFWSSMLASHPSSHLESDRR